MPDTSTRKPTSSTSDSDGANELPKCNSYKCQAINKNFILISNWIISILIIYNLSSGDCMHRTLV